MHIVFEHPHPLPVKKYGGTERILFWHMKELVRRGHQVSLIGHPQSEVQKHGIQLIPQPASYPAGVDWRSLIPQNADLLHLFYTPGFRLEIPFIVTIEGNGQPGESFHANTVFISQKHADNHGAEVFVYNGIDLDEYPFDPSQPTRPQGSWQDFMFLAKGSWKVKNLKQCIAACRSAKKNLHIAGGRSFWPSRYVRSYGMVDQIKKLEILRKVDALLFPVRWPEPFGIAIIEAFALGRPVIGSPYGSLPELISPGMGFVCRDFEDFFERVQETPARAFDPAWIRSEVERRFAIEVTAAEYEKLYVQVLQGELLHQHSPRASFDRDPQTLLEY